MNNNANSVSGPGGSTRVERAVRDGFGGSRDRVGPRGSVDVEDAFRREIERDAFEQRPHGAVGDDQLAVRVIDVAGELRPPARRVDADDRGPGQTRAQQHEDELRHVLEQHADVERSGPPQLHEQLGAHLRFLDDLAPRPASIFVEEPVGVVFRPAEDQLGEGRGRAVHYPSQRERHRVHSAHEARRYPLRFAGDDVVRMPGEKLFEQDAGLHARERRAEAQVLAEAEREVRRVHVAADVEPVRGRSERVLIAIARCVEHDEVVELLDLDPTDDRVGGHGAGERLDRRDPAQALLDCARDQRRIGDHVGALGGVLVQRERSARDQRSRRLVAGDEEGEQEDQELVAVERPAVDLRADED